MSVTEGATQDPLLRDLPSLEDGPWTEEHRDIIELIASHESYPVHRDQFEYYRVDHQEWRLLWQLAAARDVLFRPNRSRRGVPTAGTDTNHLRDGRGEASQRLHDRFYSSEIGPFRQKAPHGRETTGTL